MKFKRYFGLHFDFHAGTEAKIGSRTSKEDISECIKAAKPDFIQCDCKGHPGYSSYPTKVGIAAPNLVADNLRAWVDAAHENNIPIFMHYSGVIDMAYVKEHPEIAAELEPEDAWHEGRTSLFSTYVDDLLIPQIKELIDEYDIDGIWIDGDCWAVCREHSDLAKKYVKDDMTKEEQNEAMREAYRAYLKHYTDELHKYKPGFMVISNWAYSSYMPEKPTVDVDYLSGDLPMTNSVLTARYEGRCMAAQSIDWDLMAWSFDTTNGYSEKPATQLCQEAAMVLSLGGGMQVYDLQNVDGSIRRKQNGYPVEFAKFVRERRELNFEKKPEAQVAVYYSKTACYKKNNIFNAAGATEHLIGSLNCVLDSQYTANILLEYKLNELSNYDVAFIPEWEDMGEEHEKTLIDYAKNGGNLVISGAKNSLRFAELAGVKIGEMVDGPLLVRGADGCLAVAGEKNVLKLESGESDAYFNADDRDRLGAAYRTEKIGKGTITFLPVDLGTMYFKKANYIIRDYLNEVLSSLCEKNVTVNKKKIDITVQKGENGEKIVNLINLLEGRQNLKENVYTDVIGIDDVKVTVKGNFKSVSMPLGEKFEYEIKPDCAEITLDRLNIHSIIRLEENI